MSPTDRFWEALPIPYQEEEEDVQFANPVVVQRHFLRLTRALAQTLGPAEALAEEIATLEGEKAEWQRELARIRRDLLAGSLDRIKKTTLDMQNAFLLNVARESGREEQLEEAEAEIETREREIARRAPVLEKLRARQKAIEQVMNGGKQYLDMEKLFMKIDHNQLL